MKINFFLLFLSACFVFTSCGGPSEEEILEADKMVIVDYLTENGLMSDAQVVTSSGESLGLYYIIETQGNEVEAGLNDEVTCNYKGYFPNDEVFDENNGASFILGNTIEGWGIGIPLVGEGGTVRLFIPSYLAYGKSGRGSIPANQPIFFDVDLIKVCQRITWSARSKKRATRTRRIIKKSH